MSLEYNLDFINDKSKKSSIKKAISILERSYYKNIEEYSFFLDPFEQEVIESIANKNKIDIKFVGGNDLAERKIFIANFFYEPIDESNYINVLKFNHDGLSHPDVLGSLMSFNLERESIGDIVIDENACEFAILKDEANFVKYNLTKIKNQSINVEVKNNNELEIKLDDYINYNGFVSSLRLDNIISEFTNTSRSKAKDLIKAKLVKVNYEIIDDPSKLIKENSMISVRREGRFIFDEITGSSKKGNSHITYRKLK
ncbi:RNA-binding protein [Anaerococcus sp. mt242]|uniref:YlmH family RNA-binding protein n=1 Tax=Anaerococcus sp. mt242 TaxID=2661917 RepID=UPI0019330FED|nr:YlmH/Sll1252 family protein [Anaerococcus sp. mt242]MBM0045744.1 RNA-binding protein [Anaerococcus sp. mt242]